MNEKLRIELASKDLLHVHTQSNQTLSLCMSNGVSAITDYERLKNKPSINGVELIGNQTSASLYVVSENTVEGWGQTPMYIPKNGEIVVYTDYAKDDNDNPIPAIKIGDGNAFIADLPFVNDDIRNDLLDHINDRVVHITDEERNFWNNKLNYEYNVGDENLILNRN